MSNIKVIRPQKGPQEKFLSTTADIAIYGGAAGGGKSYGLLIEPLRKNDNTCRNRDFPFRCGCWGAVNIPKHSHEKIF